MDRQRRAGRFLEILRNRTERRGCGGGVDTTNKLACIIGGGTLGQALKESLTERSVDAFILSMNSGLSRPRLDVTLRNNVIYAASICKDEILTKRSMEEDDQKFDFVIYTVGYCSARAPQNMMSELTQCYRANVLGCLNVMESFVPLLRSDGAFATVASKAGIKSVPGLAEYSASKAAEIALVKSWAKSMDTPKFAIFSPGGFKSPMREKVYGKEDSMKQQNPKVVADNIRDIIIAGKFKTGSNFALFGGGADLVEEPELAHVV